MRRFICFVFSILILMITGCAKSEGVPNTGKQLECNVLQEEIAFFDFDQFIGFDDNNIYVAKLETMWNIYKYDRNKDEWEKISYSFPPDNILLETAVINGNILISRAIMKDESFEFEVILIDNGSEEIIIYDNKMITLPNLVLLDKSIAVNYESYIDGNLYDTLDCIEYKTGKVTNVYSDLFYRNNDNTISGTITVAIGGTENQLLIEKTELQNEFLELDQSGKTKLYSYNLKTKKEDFVKQLDTKAIFISIMDDCILTSDYAYDIPMQNTGTIIKAEDNIFKEHKVAGIDTAKDILNAYRLDDSHIIFNNMDNIYVYNTQSLNSFIYGYTSVSEQDVYSSEIKVSNNTGGYLIQNVSDKSLIFCSINAK